MIELRHKEAQNDCVAGATEHVPVFGTRATSAFEVSVAFQSGPGPWSPKNTPADGGTSADQSPGSFSLARLTAVGKASSGLKTVLEQSENEPLRLALEGLAAQLPRKEQFKLALQGLGEKADQRQVMVAASLMQNPQVIGDLRNEYCRAGTGLAGPYFNLDIVQSSITKSEDFDKALHEGMRQKHEPPVQSLQKQSFEVRQPSVGKKTAEVAPQNTPPVPPRFGLKTGAVLPKANQATIPVPKPQRQPVVPQHLGNAALSKDPLAEAEFANAQVVEQLKSTLQAKNNGSMPVKKDGLRHS